MNPDLLYPDPDKNEFARKVGRTRKREHVKIHTVPEMRKLFINLCNKYTKKNNVFFPRL